MQVTIEPRNDYVLIQRIDALPQPSSIVIPDIAKTKGITGIVVAIGPGKWIEGCNGGYVRQTPAVKVGDMVLFNSKWNDFAGDHQEPDYRYKENLHLVQEGDIYCRIDA